MKPISKYVVPFTLQCMGVLAVSPDFAQVISFDFDNAPLYSSFPISQTVGGITAQFTATGQGYSIQQADVLGFTPQGFAGRIIYPNSINKADLLIKFNSALTDFSIMYSCQELGCDDAATMRVTGYMNGSSIGTHTHTAITPGTWPVDTIRFTSPSQGFDSIVLHYDSPPPTCQDYGVIFMADNMLVTPFGALPVTLMYFNCAAKGNTAILQWESAEEINLDNYIVQYSNDGYSFQDLATITAEGANHKYSFTHQDVRGTAYYRLKMSDIDGEYKYSEVKKLTAKHKTDLTIVPNPSTDFIEIQWDNPLDSRTLQIFSIHGLILKTITDYTAGQKLNISDLSRGTYIIKVFSSKDQVSFEKFLLKL